MAKKNGKKKMSFLDYINPKNIEMEIHRYGYNFSMKKYLRNILLSITAIIALAYFYQLKYPAIIFLIVLTLLFLPNLLLSVYRNMYEQKRFDDLTNYMEQMLYSFKRRNKILTSLEDTLDLFPFGAGEEKIL